MAPYMLPFYEKDSTGNITAVKTVNHGGSGAGNYGLISNEVSLSPSGADLTFAFRGADVTVEIYGIKDGNPDLDPTSDSNLRLASYKVDFSGWDGNLNVPIAPRWNYLDMLNSVKSDSSDPLSSQCPNPNYAPAPPPPEVSTRWASLEIAPAYRTSSAISDPALGGNATIPGFTSIFRSLPDGAIEYPPSSSFAFGAPTTYVYRDQAGQVMTDYRKRIQFFPLKETRRQ